MADMVTPKEIDEMSIDDLKADFFSLMNGIVVSYGDNQSEDQQDAGTAPSNETDQSVQTQGGK